MRSRTIDLDGPLHFADFGGNRPTMVLASRVAAVARRGIAVGRPVGMEVPAVPSDHFSPSAEKRGV